jgi:hypothetical protein
MRNDAMLYLSPKGERVSSWFGSKEPAERLAAKIRVELKGWAKPAGFSYLVESAQPLDPSSSQSPAAVDLPPGLWGVRVVLKTDTNNSIWFWVVDEEVVPTIRAVLDAMIDRWCTPLAREILRTGGFKRRG